MRPEQTQTYEPNPVLELLYRRFFRHIEVDDAWVRAVRDAASRGSVVYVLRHLSFVDFLALDHLTKRFGLPQIRFANDLGLWILEPMGKGWLRAIWPDPGASPTAGLGHAIRVGGSAALFLKRAPRMLEVAAAGRTVRGQTEGDEIVRALIDVQRHHDRPILLVPQVFLWTKRPDTRGLEPLDLVFGPREWPGRVRMALQFVANYRNVVLRAGEPLDLRAFLASPPSSLRPRGPASGAPAASSPPPSGAPASRPGEARSPDSVLVRRLTYAMLTRLERERRAILGPAHKPADRVREEVLRSRKLRQIIGDMAGEGEAERAVVTARAYGMLRKLEAQPEPDVVRAMDAAFDWLVRRIYDGLDVDVEGLARVREAAKEGSLVLLPSHKSHIDYLLLSYVFYRHNLQLPVVAAGDNLAFFPLGTVFRKSGAFFIRRSFHGDKLYTALVDAYIRRLLRDGHAVELFLEGGRSRSGKLLPPKVGLLNMIVEAALGVPGRRVFFVPVCIGYDRIVETGSYVRESTGAEKEKEDAAALFRTTSVLAGRYGRLSLQFGQILELGDVRDPGAADPPTPPQRRSMVTRLAYRVMAEINRVTPVTPGALVATAILHHEQRGMAHGHLVAMCERLCRALAGAGARMSPSLVGPSGAVRPDAIERAARLFVQAGLVEARVPGEASGPAVRRRAAIYTGPDVVYVVPDDQRLSLDVSKNLIVHFFVPQALVAAGILAARGRDGGVPRGALEERVRSLSRLFKFEFMFRADASFERLFDETLAGMTAAGDVRDQADEVVPGAGHDGMEGREWLDFYASVVRPFLEGYRVAARALGAIVRGPLASKDLVKRALAVGDRMFLSGEIRRREAVSRPILENALRAFADQGYVETADGKLRLTDSFRSAAAVGAVEARIAGLGG